MENITEYLNQTKEMLQGIINLPRDILSRWENIKEALWSPFEIATAIVMLGFIISMIDRKIGLKIVRYAVVIYFIFELVCSLF